jgi:large subunit ribosomal protein L17
MRHRVAGKKLSRSPAHRKALFRNLVTELLDHEIVRTTEAKAKELRRWGDRMITLGKHGTLHARRQAASVVRSADVVRKLFDDLAGRYATRPGGYTRVIKLGPRIGDAAQLAVVELVDRDGAGGKKPGGKGGGGGGKGKAEARAAKAPKAAAKKPAAKKTAKGDDQPKKRRRASAG